MCACVCMCVAVVMMFPVFVCSSTGGSARHVHCGEGQTRETGEGGQS